MLLSLLTLLHAAGLVHAMANVSLAKVCSGPYRPHSPVLD